MTSPSRHGSTVMHLRQPTVAKQIVRKTDPAEVLVTDWHSVSDTEHVVTIEWPLFHPFYTLDSDSYSPLLFTESTRQALALLSHTAFGIPLDHRLGWDYVSCSSTPAGLRRTATPGTVELHITHTSVAVRRLGSARLTAAVRAFRDGVQVGSAQIRYTAYPQPVYRRLRGRHSDAAESCARALPAGPPVLADLVGREHERDVVLSPTTRTGLWHLRADITHPVLFDHPHDHIPGMVLLEAFAQAAHAICAPRRIKPLSFDTVFKRYVELDQPCLIEAEALDTSSIKLVAAQGDTVVASALVTAAPA